MKLYTPDDEEFDLLIAGHAWFDHVLRAERGEIFGDDHGAPEELNWLRLLPVDLEFEIEDADGSLVAVDDDGSILSIWEAFGPDDIPWCVFVVDQGGVRLLEEYSVLKLDAEDSVIDAALQRGSDEIPSRMLEGEFTRDVGELEIPAWIMHPVDRPDKD